MEQVPQWRLRRIGPPVAAVAMFCTLVALIQPEPGRSAAYIAAVTFAAIQSATLLWMPTRPGWAMVIAIASGIGIEALDPSLPLGLAAVPLCAFAAVRPPRISRWGLAAMLAFVPWRAFGGGGPLGGTFAVLAPMLAWTLGELVRTSRARRFGDARRAVAEERARIARELHDVLAHNVSVIVVQAAAAADVFETRPEQAREALRAIETSGRTALAELRRLLAAVRPDGEAMEHHPLPGLGHLDALVASMQTVGLMVLLRREGTPMELPAGVDLSAYRIVQEALTNTLRHADASQVDVTVSYCGDAVRLEVSDNGLAPPRTPNGGHGLLGMRERAAVLGGTVEAGPAPQGGFRVRAHLPVGTGS